MRWACLSVCSAVCELCLCLSAWLAYPINHVDVHQLLCTSCLWPQLCTSLTFSLCTTAVLCCVCVRLIVCTGCQQRAITSFQWQRHITFEWAHRPRLVFYCMRQNWSYALDWKWLGSCQFKKVKNTFFWRFRKKYKKNILEHCSCVVVTWSSHISSCLDNCSFVSLQYFQMIGPYSVLRIPYILPMLILFIFKWSFRIKLAYYKVGPRTIFTKYDWYICSI